jgi:hypothetical protein
LSRERFDVAFSLEQSAASALAAWLRARLADLTVWERWPEPNVKLPAKAVSVLLAGPRQDELLDPVPLGRRDLSSTRAEYTWRIRACKQPMQLDAWAKSDHARDDLVARLEPLLNASERDSLGTGPSSPRNGVVLRLGHGWDGFADFLFDAPERMDTPDAVQRCEYRATYRGHAWMDLIVRAESPRLVAATLRARLREGE